MKVLVDGRLLSQKPSGIGRYTREVIRSYVREYGANNVAVLINEEIVEENQFRVDYVKTSLKPYNIIHFLILPIFLKRLSFQLFHSPFYSGVSLRKRGKIYIVTVHDLMYRILDRFFFKNLFLNRLAVIYYNTIVRRSLHNADLIIAVSYTSSNDIRRFFNKNSCVVPEGVNLLPKNSDAFDEASVLYKYALKKNEYFLYIGNLRRQKNIPFMIRCFIKARTSKELIICGNYSQKEFLRLKNEIGSIPTSVRFLGFVNDGELSLLYANCCSFIYPSLYEGFGLPILEALVYGARVFSSNQGALSEFPSDMIHFFNPENDSELVQLIEAVNQLSPIHPDVDTLVRKFDWVTALDSMQAVIKRRFHDVLS